MIKKLKNIIKKNKDFSSFSILRIFSLLSSAIFPFVIAKAFSLSDYSVFSTNKMFIRFYMMVLLAPSIQPFILFAQREFIKKKKISEVLLYQIVLYSLSIIFIFISGTILSGTLENYIGINSIQRNLLILLLTILTLKEFVHELLLTNQQRIKASLMDLSYNVLLITITFTIYKLSHELNLTNVLIIEVVGLAISTFLGFILLNKQSFSLRNLKFNSSNLKEFLKFTIWQTFGLIAVFLLYWGDNIVLKNFIDPDRLGAYNFAYGIFSAAVSVGLIISQYFLTKVINILENTKTLKKYHNLYKPVLTILYGICSFIVILIAPLLISLVYGSKYDIALSSLNILIIASVFEFYYSFNKPLLEGSNNYKFQHINNIIAVLLNITLDIFLIQKFGMSGAAVATLIAYIYKTISTEIFVRKKIIPKKN